MPVLDGIEATKRIRDLLPRARIVAYAGSDDIDDVMAMLEAGADAYCLKGAPLWELERALAGASEPLVRLAHSIARSVNGGGTADLVARELADLTGASFAATISHRPKARSRWPPSPGRARPSRCIRRRTSSPRAFAELRLVEADTHELGELYRLGAACTQAMAAPLIADAQALGARARGASCRASRRSATRSSSRGRRPRRGVACERAPARADARRGSARCPDRPREQARLRRAPREAAARAGLRGLADLPRHPRPRRLQAGQRPGRPPRRGRRPARRSGASSCGSCAPTTRSSGSAARSSRSSSRARRRRRAHVADRVRRRSGRAAARAHAAHRSPRGVATFPDHAGEAKRISCARPTSRSTQPSSPARTSPGLRSKQRRPRAERTAAADAAALGPRGLRLLVVDDDAALRILLRTTFEVVDIEVEEADSAEEAQKHDRRPGARRRRARRRRCPGRTACPSAGR